MRAAWIALSAVLLPACTRDEPSAARPATAAPRATASATDTPRIPPTASATPKPPKRWTTTKVDDIPKAKRDEYSARMKEGRRLAADKRWGEASAAFDKALDALPGDGRALADGSWAAFQAGDLPRAERLAKQGAKPWQGAESRARCLYHLGRLDERAGRLDEASKHYAASLELRPSDAVKKQLDALPRKGAPAASGSAASPPPAAMPCKTPLADGDMLPCLQKAARAAGEDDEDDERVAGWLDEPGPLGKLEKKLRIAVVPLSRFETAHYLVASQLRGHEVVAELPVTYNPGAFGIAEDLTVERADVREIGGRRVLWLETLHTRRDSDLGVAEVSLDERREVVLCALSDEGHLETRCPVSAPLRVVHTRERLPGVELDAEVKKLATPGLPLHEETSFDVTIAGDGQVTVKLKRGAASPDDKRRTGVFPLF